MGKPTAVHLLPMSAIVGQEQVLLAIKLLAVQPAIGGLLLQGEKGTAKSTVIRSAAALLFDGPMLTLPLNATEDRLVGGVDLEQALGSGHMASARGLLAEADQGVVYVDEVNLLADHLADVLLDAAQSGVIRVHRDGVDRVDHATFALVGSMNPEEGSLRPQLLDRFGLSVHVTHLTDIDERVAVMEVQRAFDRDPASVIATYQAAEQALRTQVEAARELLPVVEVPAQLFRFIANLCVNTKVAGHRADLILTMAAKAHAALAGRWRVTDEDCTAVAELVLAHRRRSSTTDAPTHANSPLDNQSSNPQGDEPSADNNQEEQPENNANQEETSQGGGGQAGSSSDAHDQPDGQDTKPSTGQPAPSAPFTRDDAGDAVREEGGQTEFEDHGDAGDAANPGDGPAGVGEPFSVRPIELHKDRVDRQQAGRRMHSRTRAAHGRKVRAIPTQQLDDLSLIDTVRAAIPYQQGRRAQDDSPTAGPAIRIEPGDWRRAQRVRKVGSSVLFVVDASGSMGAKGRMMASKGAVLSLLLDAYVRRDQVGLIAFRRDRADVVLPFTHAVERASRELAELPTGGRTPLAIALVKAHEMACAAIRKDPTLRPLIVLVTDGRANVDLNGNPGKGIRKSTLRVAAHVGSATENVVAPDITWVVVDATEHGHVQAGRAQELADALGAACYSFTTLKRDDLLTVTKSVLSQFHR